MRLQAQFSSVGKELGMGRVVATFHAYSELKHTWLEEGARIQLKISDYMEMAPDDVLESLAWYLLSRAAGRECPPEKSRKYQEYSRSRELWEPNKSLYFERSRNLYLNSEGDERDMRPAFAYVNSFYFADRLSDIQLAWARESPRLRLGYYFEPLSLLVANKALDTAEVPRYVLEFVIFHELLHHIDAKDGRPRRRVQHTRQFREQERRFSHYQDAERWLRRIVLRTPRAR